MFIFGCVRLNKSKNGYVGLQNLKIREGKGAVSVHIKVQGIILNQLMLTLFQAGTVLFLKQHQNHKQKRMFLSCLFNKKQEYSYVAQWQQTSSYNKCHFVILSRIHKKRSRFSVVIKKRILKKNNGYFRGWIPTLDNFDRETDVHFLVVEQLQN